MSSSNQRGGLRAPSACAAQGRPRRRSRRKFCRPRYSTRSLALRHLVLDDDDMADDDSMPPAPDRDVLMRNRPIRGGPATGTTYIRAAPRKIPMAAGGLMRQIASRPRETDRAPQIDAELPTRQGPPDQDTQFMVVHGCENALARPDAGQHRLDLHDAGHRLDGAGDLRRDLC